MKNSLLTILRDKNTSQDDFRIATRKLAAIMAAEASQKIIEEQIKIETTLAIAQGAQISQRICLVPILRSGVALLADFMYYFDKAIIGFLGMKRDEKTFQPYLYYENIPKLEKDDMIIILDPMIATGGSGSLAIKRILEKGAQEQNILFVSILAAPEGISKLKECYKKITIQSVAIDQKLNQDKYILPGLGDFGDRFFGTVKKT